jgi:hypothetical protein
MPLLIAGHCKRFQIRSTQDIARNRSSLRSTRMHCGLRRNQRSAQRAGREIGSVNDAVSRQHAFTRLCEGVRDIEPACRLCGDDHTRTRESGLDDASPRASDSTEQRTR